MAEDRTSNATGDTRVETASRSGGSRPHRKHENPDGSWAEERLRKLDNLLQRIEEKLEQDDFKPTVGDFVRLLQLRKELEDERPREITVTWVEPSGDEDASAK